VSAIRTTGPLVLRIGRREVILLAGDVRLLLDAADVLADAIANEADRAHGRWDASAHAVAELDALKGALTRAPGGVLAPAVEVDAAAARLLQRVTADMAGYQRSELTPGLHDLRHALANAFPL